MLINGIKNTTDTFQLDQGFFFGYGVFETILVLKEPVMLERHIERLNKGLKVLGINKIIQENEVREVIKELDCKNEAFKINVTPENVVCTKRAIPYTKKHYTQGFSLTVSDVRKSESSHMVYIKSMNLVDTVLEHQKAKENGYDEVLFLNSSGEITETCYANIFFVVENQIYTPSISCGLLDGTVRAWVIDNFNVQEGRFTLETLQRAEGIFITNSLMGVMNVTNLCDNAVKVTEIQRNIGEKYDNFIKNFL